MITYKFGYRFVLEIEHFCVSIISLLTLEHFINNLFTTPLLTNTYLTPKACLAVSFSGSISNTFFQYPSAVALSFFTR